MPTTSFIDLAAAHRALADEIEPAVLAVLRSGHYILGPEVEAFEEAFAAHLGVRHCIGVANGSDALRLSLEALGIRSGDEVIVPSHTYIATWFAVSALGARPVPVEVDERTFVMDPEWIAAAISPRTRAIIPVHLYGHPAPMTELIDLARRHGLAVIEDAAQAHGATLGGQPIGTFGDAAAWSFYPVKNLGAAGDAGAITTNDDALARRLRLARNQGSLERSIHDIVGSCSRLDPIQAVILAAKLKRLAEWNARRAAAAERYLHDLAGTSLTLPTVARGVEHVWHQFVVRHPARDDLRTALTAAGIETLIHYETPPHRQPAYLDLDLGPGSLPIAERLAAEILSLPIDPYMAPEALDRVIATIQAWDAASSPARRTPVPASANRP